jgi:hypothetical protein
MAFNLEKDLLIKVDMSSENMISNCVHAIINQIVNISSGVMKL